MNKHELKFAEELSKIEKTSQSVEDMSIEELENILRLDSPSANEPSTEEKIAMAEDLGRELAKEAWSITESGHKLDARHHKSEADSAHEKVKAHKEYTEHRKGTAVAGLAAELAGATGYSFGLPTANKASYLYRLGAHLHRRHQDYAAKKHESNRNAYNPFGGLLTKSRQEEKDEDKSSSEKKAAISFGQLGGTPQQAKPHLGMPAMGGAAGMAAAGQPPKPKASKTPQSEAHKHIVNVHKSSLEAIKHVSSPETALAMAVNKKNTNPQTAQNPNSPKNVIQKKASAEKLALDFGQVGGAVSGLASKAAPALKGIAGKAATAIYHSNRAQRAAAMGVAGAGVGAIAAGKGNRLKGAAMGGVMGAGAGAATPDIAAKRTVMMAGERAGHLGQAVAGGFKGSMRNGDAGLAAHMTRMQQKGTAAVTSASTPSAKAAVVGPKYPSNAPHVTMSGTPAQAAGLASKSPMYNKGTTQQIPVQPMPR